ncbi:glycosyltransferase family 2 protein [Methanocaldococcus indicus]|uniref:glycosyltransferase family 2 protein n=1 Tax=Methanocaldococcus indicus TaxID=213231 RepID=UPI003C6D5635
MGLSIIMPCYRGERFIEHSIREVERIVSKFCKDFEIIVVVDGFVDKTYEIAKKLEEEFNNLKVVGYEKNRGKGYALKYGLKFCNGKYVALLDSDLECRPETLKWFIEKIKNNNIDIIIGNRKNRKSIVKYPKLRKFLSYGFVFYVNLMFPELKVKDTQTGIKMFKKEILEDLFKEFERLNLSYRYSFDVSLLVLARRKGYTIKDSPCIVVKEDNGNNLNGLKLINIIYSMGKDIIKLKMRLK